ncbi:MAG TPA: homocysteine S-methyltransferase family protein [Roseiarcus sp.]|jgi:betaine-homocysteine S-methyltransferase|nr:homocysteine S-methyltransferase family protein [Roseiarcus sp.]
MAKLGLLERLAAGPVICAEGYLFELERRGYLQAGAYVPEVVLDFPEQVENLHRDFLRAGSDVIEAFTYYAHREKLRLIGRESDLEPMNRAALALAKKVAAEGDALVAGNICNTNIYTPGDSAVGKQVRAMFEEQVGWAVEAGVDFIVAETISWLGEAELALDVMRQTRLPTVVTFALHKDGLMRDGLSADEAAKRIADKGADVVGLNCARGPRTMMPYVRKIRDAVAVQVAALPVPYRTTKDEPTFQSLTEKDVECAHCLPEGRSFPVGLDPFLATRYEIAEFGREAYAANIRYLGVCCGAGPHHVRALAEALGRRPPASRFSPDMSKHYAFGSDPRLKAENREYTKHL